MKLGFHDYKSQAMLLCIQISCMLKFLIACVFLTSQQIEVAHDADKIIYSNYHCII